MNTVFNGTKLRCLSFPCRRESIFKLALCLAKNRFPPTRERQFSLNLVPLNTGFSLLEHLMSLLLMSILSITLVLHYYQVKFHQQRMQQSLTQQADVEWVINLMRHEIRVAGFTPCMNLNEMQVYDHVHQQFINSMTAQPDQLVIKRMATKFAESRAFISKTQLITTAEPSLHGRQNIMIADCYHAEINQLMTVQSLNQHQLLTLTTPLIFDYVPPIYVGEWLVHSFSIQLKNGQRRLFYQHHRQDELTSAVQSIIPSLQRVADKLILHIELGVKNDKPKHFSTWIRA